MCFVVLTYLTVDVLVVVLVVVEAEGSIPLEVQALGRAGRGPAQGAWEIVFVDVRPVKCYRVARGG